MKKYGINEVTIIVRVGGVRGTAVLLERFAKRARGRTVTDLRIEPLGTNDTSLVRITYKHQARNFGNRKSDAARFVQTAFLGRSNRYRIEDIDARPWRPAKAPA